MCKKLVFIIMIVLVHDSCQRISGESAWSEERSWARCGDELEQKLPKLLLKLPASGIFSSILNIDVTASKGAMSDDCG